MSRQKSDILPVRRTKADAQASYDRFSRLYDLLVASGEQRFREAGLAVLGVREGECVLEIGSGTGLCLVELAVAVGATGLVFGLDLSPGMLAVADRRVCREGVSSQVHLQRGDAAHLPFSSNSFDALLISFTLELFDTPEIPLVLTESLRVLRPEGRICVVALSRAERLSLATRIYEWGHMRFPKVLDCRPIYAAHALKSAGFQLRSARELPYWGLSVTVALAVKPGLALAAPGTAR